MESSSSGSLRPCPQCGTACAIEHQYCPGCGFPIGAIGTNNDDPLVGQTLPGGYQILDLLSVGGMGRVYRAEQRALGRTVAVKVIHPHLLADENSIVRFMNEARAASQLNHPNSVSVIDFGKTDDGQPYLVMEFLRGKDLARVAYEQGPLAFRRIVDVLKQVLTALSEAHELEIVHRDLKPENIILEPMRRGGDFVKVVDFGLAKLKADTSAPNVTMPGIVCGTPDYMAPEQGRGDEIDGRADLYAVGVIFFQLLTGRLPFESDNPTQVVMMHLTIPVPDARQVAPERNIPDPLVAVLNRALAKDPGARYQDALAFADALQEAHEASELSQSLPPGASKRPTGGVECPSCAQLVPLARFCLECGGRLPLRTDTPTPDTGPILPLPLVGREEDLAWLEDRRAQVTSSAVGARLVGESGAGKTRLLEVFLDRCRTEGDLVVTTGPDPQWAEVAFYSMRAAIIALARIDPARRDLSADWQDAPEHAQRALADVFGISGRTKDQRPPLERRFGIAEAMRWALRRAARFAAPNRVILAVDDLHRIDGSSHSAFADVLGEAFDEPVLILAAHTPGFDAGWGATHAARVVAGLPPPVVTRLLSASGTTGHSLGKVDLGMRGTLPLYLDQVIRYTIDGGNDPPHRLADLIAHRMSTLESQSRSILQALGVLGDDIDVGAVEELIGKRRIQDSLDELVLAGLVVRDDNSLSLGHPLFREVVLTMTPAEVRRELHAKAVRLYEVHEAPIEARAMHAYYAQDAFEALLLIEQVAERAKARGDMQAAVGSLRRGLDLARQEIYRGELDDPMRAVAIFGRKLGDALTQAGDFSDAEGILREALDMAGPTGSDRAHVLASLAKVAHERKRQQEAFNFIDQAIEMARRSGAHDLLSDLTITRSSWAG